MGQNNISVRLLDLGFRDILADVSKKSIKISEAKKIIIENLNKK